MPLLKQIAEQLRDEDNFLVLAHVSPDGDALGSMLAMGELLDALGKKVVLFNESGIPRRFEWLAPKREILTRLPKEEPDNLIVLDCGNAERAGELIAPWLKTKNVFNIDHHLGNPMFGTLNWVEQRASSVGEMVGMLARKLGVPLVGLLGEYIYLALISGHRGLLFQQHPPRNPGDGRGNPALGPFARTFSRTEAIHRKALPASDARHCPATGSPVRGRTDQPHLLHARTLRADGDRPRGYRRAGQHRPST